MYPRVGRCSCGTGVEWAAEEAANTSITLWGNKKNMERRGLVETSNNDSSPWIDMHRHSEKSQN